MARITRPRPRWLHSLVFPLRLRQLRLQGRRDSQERRAKARRSKADWRAFWSPDSICAVGEAAITALHGRVREPSLLPTASPGPKRRSEVQDRAQPPDRDVRGKEVLVHLLDVAEELIGSEQIVFLFTAACQVVLDVQPVSHR